MRSSPKPQTATDDRRGEWTVLGAGLALLLSATVLLFISLGAPGNSLAGVILIYVFGFLGGGGVVALAVHRWHKARRFRDGADPWL